MLDSISISLEIVNHSQHNPTSKSFPTTIFKELIIIIEEKLLI